MSDPFVEHGRLMMGAIGAEDVDKMNALLKTPYVDPNGYTEIDGSKKSFVDRCLPTVSPDPLEAIIWAGATWPYTDFWSLESAIHQMTYSRELKLTTLLMPFDNTRTGQEHKPWLTNPGYLRNPQGLTDNPGGDHEPLISYLAMFDAYNDILRLLLDEDTGHDWAAADDYGNTMFHYAARALQVNNIDTILKFCWVATLWPEAQKRIFFEQRLIAAIEYRNKAGLTAIDLARTTPNVGVDPQVVLQAVNQITALLQARPSVEERRP